MTPLDLSIKGAIEEFDQGAAVNPIQQAISALESVEWHGAGSCWIADAEKVEAALTSLRSLNKEVEGVELPKFPLHDVAATAPGVVWLNIFGVESDYESGFPEDHEGITWCESEVGDLDVPYVRVDRVAAVAAALGRGAGQTEAFRQQLEIIAVGDSGNPRKDAETVLVEHGVWEASQPTQAEAASVTTSQTVDELIAYAAQEREKDAEWQQWVERGGYDGDQQAEAPSEREAWRGGSSYEASMLRNLLARIHGDGGHYVEQHGIDKALDDAEMLVAHWRAALAAQPAAERVGLTNDQRKDALAARIVRASPCFGFVKSYTDEARGVLDETYRFASTSPRGQENINAVLTLLDDIDKAVEGIKEAANHGITATSGKESRHD